MIPEAEGWSRNWQKQSRENKQWIKSVGLKKKNVADCNEVRLVDFKGVQCRGVLPRKGWWPFSETAQSNWQEY